MSTDDRHWPDADRELETAAAAVHQAYLDTCTRLGWPVKPSNQVPYEELSEEAKELDRASVRAVQDALTTRLHQRLQHIADYLNATGQQLPDQTTADMLETLLDNLDEDHHG